MHSAKELDRLAGTPGARAAAAEKALKCPARTEQGKLITQRAGLWFSSTVLHTVMSPAWWWRSAQDPSCFVHAWGGTGTRIGDRASYVMQGGGKSHRRQGLSCPQAGNGSLTDKCLLPR